MPINLSWADILLKKTTSFQASTKSSLVTIISPDAYLEKLFINDFINKEKDTNRIILLGSELNEDIILNFFTADLFSHNEEIFILQAEAIPAKAYELILLKLKNKYEASKIIYFFFGKECKISKEINKQNLSSIQISAPKFWEFEKVLDILCKRFALSLSDEVKSYFLSAVILDLAEYLRAIESLAQEMQIAKSTSLNLELIRELLPQKRLDQFALAHFWGQKNFKLFFKKIIEAHLDFGELEDFFRFMQGHLLKVMDCKLLIPSTKYEREMGKYRHLWNNHQLICDIDKFSKWQIMSKEKSFNIEGAINLEMIHSL